MGAGAGIHSEFSHCNANAHVGDFAGDGDISTRLHGLLDHLDFGERRTINSGADIYLYYILSEYWKKMQGVEGRE